MLGGLQETQSGGIVEEFASCTSLAKGIFADGPACYRFVLAEGQGQQLIEVAFDVVTVQPFIGWGHLVLLGIAGSASNLVRHQYGQVQIVVYIRENRF